MMINNGSQILTIITDAPYESDAFEYIEYETDLNEYNILTKDTDNGQMAGKGNRGAEGVRSEDAQTPGLHSDRGVYSA